MATKEGYYGSDDTSNTFKGNGTNWFTLVNKKVGDIDLYEDVLEDDFWDQDPYDPLDMCEYISDGTFLSLDSTEISLSDYDGEYIFLSYI